MSAPVNGLIPLYTLLVRSLSPWKLVLLPDYLMNSDRFVNIMLSIAPMFIYDIRLVTCNLVLIGCRRE